MRPGARACVAFGFVVALAGQGCDWRKFDDLKKQTPVAAISAPSNYAGKNDFGPNLLAVPPPSDGSAAGRFVAAATFTTGVAVVSFDATGSPSGVGVTGNAFDLLSGGPITSIALVPDKRQVLLGAPTDDFGDVMLMELDKPVPSGSPYPVTTFRPTVGEHQFGVGVGAGYVGGGAAPELVVLSQDTLHVYVDGQATSDATRIWTGAADPCPLDFPLDLPEPNRAVIVEPMLGPGMQIAVGTPVLNGAGHVTLFGVDLTVTPAVFTCPVVLTGSEAHFGRAMTVVDLSGDGVPDHLLVGAPPTHAYLYSLPLSAGQTPETITDPEPMTNGQFGAAVAALDIDGKPGDEMFIGNPDGSVGGTSTAGRVSVYTGSPPVLVPTTVAPNPLTEHDPGGGHAYGSGIAGMLFCPGNVGVGGADAGTGTSDGGVAACKRLPIIGSLSKVYAYFTLNKPDPRAK